MNELQTLFNQYQNNLIIMLNFMKNDFNIIYHSNLIDKSKLELLKEHSKQYKIKPISTNRHITNNNLNDRINLLKEHNLKLSAILKTIKCIQTEYNFKKSQNNSFKTIDK